SADGFQSTDLGSFRLTVPGQQSAKIPLSKQSNSFVTEPPVEKCARWLRHRKKHDLIETKQRTEPRRHFQGIARKISLRNNVAKNGDDKGREQKGSHSGQNRIREQRQKNIGYHIPPDDRGQW